MFRPAGGRAGASAMIPWRDNAPMTSPAAPTPVPPLAEADLNRLQNEQRRLDNDHQRLITERQIAATNLRVEQMAREKLQMRMPTPAVTQYVTDGPLPTSAAASGAVP